MGNPCRHFFQIGHFTGLDQLRIFFNQLCNISCRHNDRIFIPVLRRTCMDTYKHGTAIFFIKSNLGTDNYSLTFRVVSHKFTVIHTSKGKKTHPEQVLPFISEKFHGIRIDIQDFKGFFIDNKYGIRPALE